MELICRLGGTVIINSFYVEDFGKLYRSVCLVPAVQRQAADNYLGSAATARRSTSAPWR